MRKALQLLAFAFLGVWPLLGKDNAPANSILVIEPYRHAGTWVFDDKEAGLRKEPFVAGAPEIIDKMVKDIPNADGGFRLLFSSQAFPGETHRLLWRRGEKGGNWYYSAEYKIEGIGNPNR